MNVGKLKQLIENVPDNVSVLIPGNNHDYYSAYGELTTALKSDREWTEDYGEEKTPESEWGTCTLVLVIRA